MKPAHILEKSDHEGRVYFKAVGFLDGKSYRGRSTAAYPRTNALRIMTRNPNARHPQDWSDPACHVRVYMGHEVEIEQWQYQGCPVDDHHYRNSVEE